MLNYSFFNSVIDQEGNPDRAFDANDFSKYFGTLIKNGIFPNPSSNFQIQGDQGNMSVKAERGLAWIEGHLAYDDSVFILNIDPADSVLDRIDRVVLRLDTLERCIKWVVKKGELSAKPIAKELQRDADAYEIGIADVAVNHGIASITQSMITDLRMNTELCGWVTGTVTQIDTTTLFNQMEQWKNEYIAKSNNWTTEQKNLFLAWVKQFETDSSTWKTEQEELFANWSTTEKNKFDEWLKSIKDVLSGDVAGNILTKVNKNTEDISNNKDDISRNREDIKKLKATYAEVTLEAGKWSGQTYSLEDKYPSATYDIEIELSGNATKDIAKVWGRVIPVPDVSGKNEIKALGDIPNINIPVRVKAVKK